MYYDKFKPLILKYFIEAEADNWGTDFDHNRIVPEALALEAQEEAFEEDESTVEDIDWEADKVESNRVEDNWVVDKTAELPVDNFGLGEEEEHIDSEVERSLEQEGVGKAERERVSEIETTDNRVEMVWRGLIEEAEEDKSSFEVKGRGDKIALVRLECKFEFRRMERC